MMRLFVAIDLPKEIKEQFTDLVDRIKEEGYPLSFEKEENFHLTLKFLGWIEEKKRNQFSIQKINSKSLKPKSKIEEIKNAIRKSLIGIKPFWLKPTKIDYFLKESLILWIGIKGQEGLFKLASQLEDEFAKIGFAKEKRAFLPHITFAKKRRAFPLSKWQKIAEEIKKKFNQEFKEFKIEEIVLMQSTLAREGSIYTPLEFFSF